MPTRLNIQKCAKSLMLQLFSLSQPDDSDNYTDGGRETDVNDNAMHEKKLEDQLEQSVLLATMEKTGSDAEYKSIAKDMLVQYMKHLERGPRTWIFLWIHWSQSHQQVLKVKQSFLLLVKF